MSDSSVVCPHCAARRKVAPKLQLDRDEVRALLVMEGAAKDDDERDWLATLVLPHPATSGGARGFEIALTIAAFPFVMSGALTFALHRLRGKGRIKMRGEAGPLTLLSCDNLPRNGVVLRRLVHDFCARMNGGAHTLEWLERNARFPSTMVDRVVPSTTPGGRVRKRMPGEARRRGRLGHGQRPPTRRPAARGAGAGRRPAGAAACPPPG